MARQNPLGGGSLCSHARSSSSLCPTGESGFRFNDAMDNLVEKKIFASTEMGYLCLATRLLGHPHAFGVALSREVVVCERQSSSSRVGCFAPGVAVSGGNICAEGVRYTGGRPFLVAERLHNSARPSPHVTRRSGMTALPDHEAHIGRASISGRRKVA